MKISNQSKVESRKPGVFRLRNFFGARPSTLDPRPSQRGIALVITLILLSVTLVMAVAFLAISNRERSAVTTTTDATTARLAAETALASAESQIIANMNSQNGPGTNNPYNYGLLVSTNYINPNGFDPAAEAIAPNPTNVNYDYLTAAAGGGALSLNQLQQNLANLFYSPRVPVYIATNGGTDFRFYLDLNHNGRFDTNNFPPGADTVNAGPTGDPEWVGVLERPDTTHGPNNKFLSRYAFIAIPVGNTLDVNYIHNQVQNQNLANQDGFFRNEGVGSWEINLAAFLTDLNTNQWDPVSDGYNYRRWMQPSPGFANNGRGFEDAFSILANRYNDSYSTLAVPPYYSPLVNAGIDNYTLGALMTNTQLPLVNYPFTPAYWVGSDNTNHLFTPSDFYNPNVTSPAFTNSLISAGNGSSNYDRYTFYRMLSQLGTDSTPESGLMNLNYDNVDPGYNGALNASGTASVTNYVPWTPINFFTIAADRILRLYTTNWFLNGPSNYLATYYGATNYPFPITINQFGDVKGLTNVPNGLTNQIPAFGIASIPVLVNGQFVYSSAVNRLLQLAANMYDATTNRYYDASSTPLPTVFRPIFGKVLNSFGNYDVYITNFVEVTDTSFLNNTIRSLIFSPSAAAALQPNDLVFGVPLIIGAKKGFPNFNEFYMEDVFQLTRKIQVSRSDTNVSLSTTFTNLEMFNVSLTNSFGVELWNSYHTNYTRPTYIYVTNYLTMTLTNDENLPVFTTNSIASGFTNIIVWSGYNSNFPSSSFQVPLGTNFAAMPVSMYRFNNFAFPFLTTNLDLPYEIVPNTSAYGKFPQPHWGLTITNNLQVIMVDVATGRLIDYVQLNGPNTVCDLSNYILTHDTNGLWNTALYGNTPAGISKQLQISQGPYANTYWGNESQKQAYDQINAFRIFNLGANTLLLNYPGYVADPTQIGIAKTTNAMQAPYTPTATVVQHITWQANDPLVHYIASDLNSPFGNGLDITPLWPANLGKLNQRYMPWGGNPQTGVNTYPYNLAIQDPLIYSSDNWGFPTYKLPTVGWLGRVHRGTPWQTVYLKASNILKSTNGLATWQNWTGNTNATDAINGEPTQDHLLFDLFTTAPNDNATRGQLPVNVGAVANGRSLAAWSALFSGMVVPTSLTNSYTIIGPAGVSNNANSQLWEVVTNINDTRTNTALFPLQAFTHKGDILTVTNLTEQSPFLNWSNTVQKQYGISDEVYEWLPQQMMSLVRAPSAPRYVIYCYGQALRPAQNGILTGGSYLGMVTNYQVVTESAARAVIRVDGANTPSPHIVVESFNLLPPD